MKFNVVTIFPKLIEASFQEGLIAQAIKKNIIELNCFTPRVHTKDLHKTVDDRPFGGGDGMTMLAEPLVKTIEEIKQSQATWVVCMSPQGALLNHSKVLELADKKNLTLVCGRYGGIDQRFINSHVNEEISIGDYILSGGELAAAVIIDSVSRQIPGVLGDKRSSEVDSFSDKLVGLLEAPQFTRPQEFSQHKVPDILLSGHHANIEKWREKISFLITLQKRKDLLRNFTLSNKKSEEIESFFMALSEPEKQVLGLKLTEQDLKQFLREK